MDQAPIIDVDATSPDWLIVRTWFEGLFPCDVLEWFIDAPRLNQWWGEEALIEPRPGGLYEVHWPAMNWTMRGVVALRTEDTLIYSWTWDHEPNQPARAVIVHVEPAGHDTVLTITHGPYRPSAADLFTEDEDRESHHEGWLFFLPKLHETIAKTRLR
jgi:hypothetical protein